MRRRERVAQWAVLRVARVLLWLSRRAYPEAAGTLRVSVSSEPLAIIVPMRDEAPEPWPADPGTFPPTAH